MLPEYREMAKNYAKIAAKAECIFEVNTGAIARGYRKTPYPSAEILHTLRKEGAKIMLNSDCHHADNLTCHFPEARAIIRDAGFKEIWHLKGGKFISEAI